MWNEPANLCHSERREESSWLFAQGNEGALTGFFTPFRMTTGEFIGSAAKNPVNASPLVPNDVALNGFFAPLRMTGENF
jgi:hypothetical protein